MLNNKKEFDKDVCMSFAVSSFDKTVIPMTKLQNVMES
jgi:hypothetical protein